MAEFSQSPEASEKPVGTELDEQRYLKFVNRAKSWGRKQDFPFRYDSEDWRWHFFVGFEGVIGPALHVRGMERAPLPKQPSWIDKTFKGAKSVSVLPDKTDASAEWTISWGDSPEEQYIVYNKIPHERSEGLQGKTPAIENGWYSASGKEPTDWNFPRAKDCKAVDIFEVTEKMLDVLEKSKVHKQGVHNRPAA